MRPYFTRERLGPPQILAGFLLLAFLAQALWLVYAEVGSTTSMESDEAIRIGEGLKQWRHHGIAGAPMTEPADNPVVQMFQSNESGFDTEHSPLLPLASSAPLLIWPHELNLESEAYWRWLPRMPFLACGLFLGASLWYVARRLCGNTGGFIALTLYCFSPSFIQASAAWHTEPEVVAAWGVFGTIFTSIAVAHTLYAPREVVLWNWRRIVLLGISLAIAVGSQFSLIILVPIALGFLLYVAPVRRGAGFVIWLAASVVGLLLFVGMYFFHLQAFSESMRHAALWNFSWRGFAVPSLYLELAKRIGRASVLLALMMPVAVVSYLLWPRTRYFGNTAPLSMGILFIVFSIGHPHTAGAGFLLASIPFLFIFVSGVLADLLETSYRPLVLAVVWTLLSLNAATTLIFLARVPKG